MFSTMTTAPSTTMPKSSAPSESRFAGICRQVQADRREQQRKRNRQRNDERAARTLPRKRNRMTDNQDDSLGQVVQDRVSGECTRSLRSRNGTIFTPGGRICSFSSFTFAWIASSVSSAFGALAQQHDALHHVVVVDDLSVASRESPCRSGRAGSSGPA